MDELNEKKLEWSEPTMDVINIKEETLGGDVESGPDLGIFVS